MSERLLDFFPPNKRDEESFARHFEAEDMKQLVTFQSKKQLFIRKETIVEHVKSVLEEGKITEVKGSEEWSYEALISKTAKIFSH